MTEPSPATHALALDASLPPQAEASVFNDRTTNADLQRPPFIEQPVQNQGRGGYRELPSTPSWSPFDEWSTRSALVDPRQGAV